MRISSLAAILAVGIAPAVSALSFGSSAAAGAAGGDDDHLKIPGDSPLSLCAQHDHSQDLVTITRVDLAPNPPKPGKVLQIRAIGAVKETIEEGAYVLLQVKYGLIRLIKQTIDLCEQVGNVDLECPIEPGVLDLTKEVELPNEIPPGKYTVLADVYTADDKPITCLTASVVMSRAGALGDLLDNFDL
jgi:hypothetical protein